jgi:hypothetical protein
MQTWEFTSLFVVGGTLLRIVYVAIARHYRNRGWPQSSTSKGSGRKIDRMEMQRLDREYGQKDREER